MCLLSPSNYSDKSVKAVCSCGDNYQLDSDGRTCNQISCNHDKQTLCNDGLCVYNWQIGDGTKDCSDDEESDFVKSHNLCQSHYPRNHGIFTCKSTTKDNLTGKSTLPGSGSIFCFILLNR